MNIRDSGPVPFGLRGNSQFRENWFEFFFVGTIVTLHAEYAEVVFDEEYIAGTNLSGRFLLSIL